MPSLRPTRTITATISLFLCLAVIARAQINGNATISSAAPVFGQTLALSTSTQFAGAVSSIKWGNKEFINNWDHGRQLQLNAQFFNRFECYNPYEAGSLADQNLPASTSKLLSLSASGNHLESETQMAWYLTRRLPLGDHCGDPNNWLPIPDDYNGPLSDYRTHKTVTIGYDHPPAHIENVIEYQTDLFVPGPVLKGINNATAVLPYEFSSVRAYDVVSKDYRKIHELSGEDDSVHVVATADGNYAFGYYDPEMLQPYGNGTTIGNWWFVVPPNPNYPDPNDPTRPDPNFACVHIGITDRYESLNGPAYSYDRAYLVVGNLSQVQDGLTKIHQQFAALDRDVFDWRDYVALNGLQSVAPTQAAAENHWITLGMGQGLRASKTFSASQYLQLNPDLANAFGATNYAAAISHYISSGRSEGRGTGAQPAPGMQHVVVLANASASALGQNIYGQIGDGTAGSNRGPTPVSLDRTVTEVAARDYTSLAVKSDGSSWGWGSNQYGARGDGTSGDNITAPVRVPLPAQITTPTRFGRHAIALGTGCYAAIDTEGQVWTWGVNWNGRLGDGTGNPHYTPARVKKSGSPNDYLTGIVSIAIGGGTMAAVDADGMIWTWGAGESGQLGNGFTQDSAYPVQVVRADSNNASTPLAGMSQVTCGSTGFCIALARYGQVFGWGNNDFAQMGIAPGGALSIATPITIGPGSIDTIAAGSAHCLAHTAVDGKVYGWGYNGYGQLGTGSPGVVQFPPAAMDAGPDGMNNITVLAAGANFSTMIRYTDRALFVSGDNQSGQLGIPSNPLTQSVPVRSSVVAP
jgi:alpha-tubulin suppressor-like RCC1 family protein